MKFTFAVAAIVALAQQVAAQSLTINSLQNVVVCQPILLTWAGGAPPYWVTLTTGANPPAPIKELATSVNDQSLTWTVDQPAGTSLNLQIRDGTGATNNAAPFTVLEGSNTACLTASASSSASSTDISSSVSSAASSASSAASSAISSASSAASSAVSSASSAASSAASSQSTAASSTRSVSSSGSASASSSGASTSPTNGASTLSGAGFAGIVGAAAAFFLA